MNGLIKELWNIKNKEKLYSSRLFTFNNGYKCYTLHKYPTNNPTKTTLDHIYCYKNEKKKIKNIEIAPAKQITNSRNVLITVFRIFYCLYLSIFKSVICFIWNIIANKYINDSINFFEKICLALFCCKIYSILYKVQKHIYHLFSTKGYYKYIIEYILLAVVNVKTKLQMDMMNQLLMMEGSN
eukprot:421579_1